MLNQDTLNSPLSPPGSYTDSHIGSQKGEADVVSEFRVGGDRYQVLVLNYTSQEANTENELDFLMSQAGVDNFSEVAHFTINHQFCCIISIPEHKENAKQSVIELQSLLTERELQIAALVAFGKVNKQIAKQLHISEWTVATYLRRMFAKLRVDSRAALVYRCAPLIRKFQELSKP